jgi:hypothetical protein
MTNFQAVSKTTHADKRWKRYEHYQFAAKDAVTPLVAYELPRALAHLPIGFIQHQDNFVLVAVLGLQAEQNLFVSPDGRWIGGYIPAIYRGYPFQLAASADGQSVLVFDEDSGLISDTEGERFFDVKGNPEKAVKEVLDFLGQVQNNREVSMRICAALQAEDLIQPWTITLKGKDSEQTLQGLYRIDEDKLNRLDADALHRLQQVGALPVAYCQLFSMQHLQLLGKLAEAQANVKVQQASNVNGKLDLEFLKENGTINFGNL